MLFFSVALVWQSELYKKCYSTKQLLCCIETALAAVDCIELLMMSPRYFFYIKGFVIVTINPSTVAKEMEVLTLGILLHFCELF